MTRRMLSIFCLILFQLQISAQSYEMELNRDTINRLDATGKKQGKWVVMGYHKPGKAYAFHQKIEEGYYLNNRKSGLWKEYFPNGSLKNLIPYVDGRPNGLARMFYENGQLAEKGIWKKNRWVGDYWKYNEDGSLQHYFHFDQKGKRDSSFYAPAKSSKK